MQNLRITIITVVRNDVLHIEHTMSSVINQDYSNLEYILVDGASTDGTKERIQMRIDTLSEEMRAKVKFISEPDNGIYDAMNKGLKLATGHWVNFMNAGDTFANNHVLSDIFGENGKISRPIREGRGGSLWVLGGNTLNVYPDGHIEEHHAEQPSVIPFRMPFSHQATFVRIQPETFCFGMNYKYSADYKLLYDLYFAYGDSAFLILDLPIAHYRQEDSLSMDPKNQRAIKSEYLRIQSVHRSWTWWKEYLKFRLF